MNIATLRTFVRYQETGDRSLFESFWADAEEFVGTHAARRLARHLVAGPNGFTDPLAVAEVKQNVAWKLLRLPGRRNKSGWFDAERYGFKVDRLRGWLHRIVQNETAEYCRTYRTQGGRDVKVVAFGDLEFNDVPGGEPVLKDARKVDFDAFELREIVAACVGELSPDQRQLYEVVFVEGLSQRKAAVRLGVAAAQVCRRQQKMLAVLREKLRARGIDADWLHHAA
jgi:RNA polymerase sigma factor (sigma-70 family)